MLRDANREDSNAARKHWIRAITFTLGGIVCTTALVLMIAVYYPVEPQQLIFIYLIPTTLIATHFGTAPSMVATILSAFAAIYFIYAPRFSFRVADPLDLIALFFFALLSILVSRVVYGFATKQRPKSD